jgi:membrane-associated phospholipid phosphatase
MQTSEHWAKRHLGRLALLFIGVLLPLMLLGAAAEDVVEKEAFSFDQPILIFAHSHASPFLDALMYGATQAGSALAIIPLCAIVLGWLWHAGRRSDAGFWLLAVGGAAAINFLAKQGFARVRPALWISHIEETTYSFPSGHAMASMALAAAVCVLLWPSRWRWLALSCGVVFVALVGASRVYFGVHYPSDVLAGWAASLAWVLGLKLLFDVRHARGERLKQVEAR